LRKGEKRGQCGFKNLMEKKKIILSGERGGKDPVFDRGKKKKK